MVICKVKEIKSPVHEVVRGYRLVAVVPNKAGNCWGRPCTSAREQFIVRWNGDYKTYPDQDKLNDFELDLLTDPLLNIDKVVWELG